MLEAIKRRIAELGPNFNPSVLDETRSLYAALLPAPPRGVRVLCDIPYMSDERHRLDLYAPVEGAGLPIILYVPGGGFVACEKRDEHGFYANIGHYFAARGFLFLAMNYRLAPEHPWPAGGEDVGYAVRWAREVAAAHGGDPERIAIFGQSAGASHVLTWLFDPVLEGDKPVVAAVLSSGTYRIPRNDVLPNVSAYFGADTSRYEARSPIAHVKPTNIQVLLTVSEFDPPRFAAPTFGLAEKLTSANGKAVKLIWFAGHNHVSYVFGFGTPDGGAPRQIEEFLRQTLA